MYKMILRMISRKNYKSFDDLQKKIDILYMSSKLNDEEYESLTTLIMKGGE